MKRLLFLVIGLEASGSFAGVRTDVAEAWKHPVVMGKDFWTCQCVCDALEKKIPGVSDLPSIKESALHYYCTKRIGLPDWRKAADYPNFLGLHALDEFDSDSNYFRSKTSTVTVDARRLGEVRFTDAVTDEALEGAGGRISFRIRPGDFRLVEVACSGR